MSKDCFEQITFRRQDNSSNTIQVLSWEQQNFCFTSCSQGNENRQLLNVALTKKLYELMDNKSINHFITLYQIKLSLFLRSNILFARTILGLRYSCKYSCIVLCFSSTKRKQPQADAKDQIKIKKIKYIILEFKNNIKFIMVLLHNILTDKNKLVTTFNHVNMQYFHQFESQRKETHK